MTRLEIWIGDYIGEMLIIGLGFSICIFDTVLLVEGLGNWFLLLYLLEAGIVVAIIRYYRETWDRSREFKK